MKTRLIRTAIRLVLLLVYTAPAAQAQYLYTTNVDSTITIIGYNGVGGDVTIPEMINGYPVATIWDQAFANCTSLTNVTISKRVSTIGYQAFAWCSSLANVTFNTNLIAIGDWAFFGCTSLTNVVIPNRVVTIGAVAFSQCQSLTNITIGSRVATIGDFALPFNLTTITVSPFNSTFMSLDGVLFNKNQTVLIQFPGGRGGSYTIPTGITNIGAKAFYYCTSLNNIVIADSVTTIDNQAFAWCTSLTNFIIPNRVTKIAESAFRNCSSITKVSIPNSVTSVGTEAFGWCTNLLTVTVGSSITNLGGFAFGQCLNLKSVSFQGNTPSLGTDVFSGVANVTVYYLPGTLGWTSTFSGRPAVLWNPKVQTGYPSFGVGPKGFGFTITGRPGIPILIEATPNLAISNWSPFQTTVLTNGSAYVGDSNWSNSLSRFYRLRMP